MSMNTPFETIVVKWLERRNANNSFHNSGIQARDQYNGDIVLPVLNKADIPLAVNLVKQGADTLARQVNSTSPKAWFPASNPGNERSERHARQQRQALLSTWDQNKMKLKDRRRTRHMIVYGTTPVTVRAIPSRGTYPIWDVRDPLATFPCPTNDPEDIVPYDCIFTYKRPYSWIKRTYPDKALSSIFQSSIRNGSSDNDRQYTLIEYIDDYEIVLGVIGDENAMYANVLDGKTFGELDRVANYANRPLTVIPRRVTLDRILGQFNGQLGMFSRQAEMLALTHEALKRGIVPTLWVVGRDGMIPTIHSIPNPDAGELGQISGGDIVPIKTDPSFMAPEHVRQLGDMGRQDAGVPVEFGGQSGSNIRTGARGNQLMQSVVDFPVQEYQEILEIARIEEDKIAIAVEKSAWGNKSKSVFVNWEGAQGRIDYVPNKLWDSDDHFVSYSFAGADANNLAVAAGQRNAMGTLSKKSFMEMDPMVSDAEQEYDRVTSETIENTILQGFQMQVQQGLVNIVDAARVAELVAEDKMSHVKAILQAQKEAQQRQATQQSEEQGEPTAPVPPGSPEAQPGITPPGSGAEAGIQGPPPDLQNLSDLMHAYRGSAQQPKAS